MKDVLAIIVTYNRSKLLVECLSALLSQNEKCDILVIDNASIDGTKDVVMQKKDISNDCDIIYYNTGENLGGAGGYNVGIKEACKYDYKYFWLMDDDCIVSKNALENLLRADKVLNGQWGFLSSKVLWTDGSICKTNVQRKKVAKKIKDFLSPLVNVDYASFVSLLIKKEDVLKIGLPIKEFFIWTDDLEYTRRFTIESTGTNGYIPKKGYLVNKSEVVHKCKENIGVDISKDGEERLDRYKYIYRNDVYTFKREGIVGVGFLVARYLYHILKIVLSGKDMIKKISIINKGYAEGYKFNPIIEYINEW